MLSKNYSKSVWKLPGFSQNFDKVLGKMFEKELTAFFDNDFPKKLYTMWIKVLNEVFTRN